MKNTKKYTGNKRVQDVPSVLNEVDYVDSVPVGMTEARDDTKSANFGTPRDSVKAGALVGNGSMYVDCGNIPEFNIPNIRYSIDVDKVSLNEQSVFFAINANASNGFIVRAASDGNIYLTRYGGLIGNVLSLPTPSEKTTVSVFFIDGIVYLKVGEAVVSSVEEFIYNEVAPTLIGAREGLGGHEFKCELYNFKVDALDSQGNYVQTLAHYKTQEGLGNTVYDSSGNDNHGTIINPYAEQWGEHNGYSYADEEGYTNSLGIVIPKDDSVTLSPLKDVLGNDLQYIGKVPSKAEYVESPCLISDGVVYLSGDVLTTDVITAGSGSSIPTCTIDGRLDFVNGEKYWDINIERGGSLHARLPLSEEIIDFSNHTYHDVS